MKKFLLSYKTRSAPYTSHGRFYNYPQEASFSVIIPSLSMYMQSLMSRIFHPRFNPKEWVQKQTPRKTCIEPVITWIGHATLLIQIGGLNILTDPLFGRPSILYSRILPPGINLHELPPIDAVVLSHNHHDHMHAPSLIPLERAHKPRVLVPEKVGNWFNARKFSKVQELTWWDTISIPAKDNSGGTVDITFLPSRHWSQRGLFDRNKTLWGSWMISYKEYTIYFAGDTAYGPHFTEIGEEFKNITTALLPIAPGEPHKLLHHSHINARQAVQAFCDLKAQEFIPMHWGTFYFGTDSFYKPIEALLKAWGEQKELLDTKMLRVAKVGEQLMSMMESSMPIYVQHDRIFEKQ